MTPKLNFSCMDCARDQELEVEKLNLVFSTEYCETHGGHFAVDIMAQCPNCEAVNIIVIRDDQEEQ